MESNINWIMVVLLFMLGGIILGMVYVINLWRAQHIAPTYDNYPHQRPVVVSGDSPRNSVNELMIFIIGILMIGGVFLKPNLDKLTEGKPKPEKNNEVKIDTLSKGLFRDSLMQKTWPKPVQRGSLAKTTVTQGDGQEESSIAGPKGFYVQMAAFTDWKSALKNQKAWHGVGNNAANIYKSPEGYFKVVVGPFENRRAANTFIARYNPNGFVLRI